MKDCRNAPRPNESATMGTTSKALVLLDLFTRQRPLIGLSELARLSGTNKATCYRLMTELMDHGLIEQVGTAREYRIGPAVLRLAALREATVPTREAAQPILQALATATGETAHMSHLVAGRLVTMAYAYSSAHGMRIMMEDADTLAFHATSSGFAVLAFSDPAFTDAVLKTPLAALTPATPTDPDAVRERLVRTRATGLAQTENTFEADVSSLAVPLFGSDGTCIGALAVAAPAMRMTPDLRARILPELLRAARDLVALWGGTIPADVAALWTNLTDTTERAAP